jgi:Chaperone of endosialidase
MSVPPNACTSRASGKDFHLDKPARFFRNFRPMKTTIRLFFALLALFSLFAAGREAQAVVPPPDGGYPSFTTAEGQKALFSLTTGAANTAVGWSALLTNATGSFNTATGAGALLFNTADENTAFGAAALLFNTIGERNTAIGAAALLNNTEGGENTAIGDRALSSNTTGNFNTAVGDQALLNNITGQGNTAIGDTALANNPPGNFNTAIGTSALLNTTGAQNTGIGANTLAHNTAGNSNTAIGHGALFSSTGSGNIALGQNAGGSVTTASNVICIGASGANVDGGCYIGNAYFNVQPIVGTDPDSVTITSTGRLGRGNVSSRRYKHDIQPMDKASEMLYTLKPVSFRYNKEYDATQTLAFGLIAEEVAKVYPDLVGRNPKGEPESVRYEQINAMLLNEFLKEHRKVEKLEATVADLAAQLQKVTAQVQMDSSSAKVAVIAR